MTAATYNRPNNTTQSPSTYKAYIDAMAKVFERMAAAFAAHAVESGSPAPDLAVVIDAGAIFNGITLTEVAAQTVAGFTTPASGYTRIDRVVMNPTTGVASRIAGTAVAGSPSATASAITAGLIPICQISFTDADTAVTNDMITDERVIPVITAKMLQDKAFDYAAASSVGSPTGQDYQATFTPAITAYTTGMAVRAKFDVANVNTAPTFDAGGGGKKMFAADGTALAIGDIPAGGRHLLQYDATLDSSAGGWLVMNIAGGGVEDGDKGDIIVSGGGTVYTVDALAISEGKLAASAVAQGKLKTTTASGTVAVAQDAKGSYALTGGTYALWTMGCGSTADSGPVAPGCFGNHNTAAGTVGLAASGALFAGEITFYFDERYVQASPPYRHGPLFVHLAIDSLGKIKFSRVAPDPIHAYHGPTNIAPEVIDPKTGKQYRRVLHINGVPMTVALKDPALQRAYMEGTAKVTHELVEITLAYKDSDMLLFPHPFVGNDMTGLTVVMLEPSTTLMQKLADFCECGVAREARDLILADKLVIGNTDLAVPNTSPGVMTVSARWKLT